MTRATLATVLFLLMSLSVVGQKLEHSESISVAFAVDGKPIACDQLRVELHLDGHTIVPTNTGSGFVVPAVFNRKASECAPRERVDVSVGCGRYTLNFPKLHPMWISRGSWELGIACPPNWFERFGSTTAIEQGTWLSYLESECDGCDPGVVTTISHSTPLPSLVALLFHEQPSATGGRARDIAYALAVFGSAYHQNRDYLLELFNACISRPAQSAENDVCNSRLLDYVTNLYWRGDSELLAPLLQSADERKDVIDEIGTFYGNLLDRHPDAALLGMRGLSADKQRMVCRLAGEDDFSFDPPKLERVTEHLQSVGDQVAERCLEETQIAVQHVPR